MTKEQREELRHIKSEANGPKRELIDLIRRIESISPAQAAALDRIVGKLESWQNK